MVQGFNNLSAYQQMLNDTTPKTAEYFADKIARSFTGGKDYMPKTVVKTGAPVTPGFSPIKGVGGLAGASLMLLPEWHRLTKNLWNNMNLNTMDPATRDEYLKGYQKTMNMFGKDVSKDIAKYQTNGQSKQDFLMPGVAEAVNAVMDAIASTKKQSAGNNKPIGSSTNAVGQPQRAGGGIAGGGGVTGGAAPTLEEQLMAMAPSAKSSNTATETSPENLQAVNDYISKLQEVNRPYTEALNNYINRYNDLARDNFNAQRYFTALSGWTGNQGYNKLAEALNPLNNEANRINAMKMVRDAEAGNVNAINEMMGNLAMAEELGLPPEAAFANKNLLTAMSMQNRDNTKLEIAMANNLVKKYGIDKNYARAIAQQQLRNQGSLAVANTYMSGGGGVAPGLNQGGTARSYTSPVTTQDPRAQFFK